MKPSRAVLIPIALSLSLLLPIRFAHGIMQVPHKGCDLPFQPGGLVTITDGGGYATIDMTRWTDAAQIESESGCVDQLNDATSQQPNCSAPQTAEGNVHIYTKRDDGNKFLYFLFDVDDKTTQFDPTTGLGDRLIIQIDSKPSGATSLTAATFRLDYQVPRGSPGTAGKAWYQGSTANGKVSWNKATTPANLAIAAGNRSDNTGYRVAVQIPLKVTETSGSNYDLTGNGTFPEFGIAIAVINDIGCKDADGYEVLAGAAFPNQASPQDSKGLSLSNANDPMLVDLSFQGPGSPDDNWFNPSLWGTGMFGGAGDPVYISRFPHWYTSEDIKTVFCNVATFADVIGPGQPKSNWYQYFSSSPCDLGTFAQFRVKTPGRLGIRRRVIFFWAEAGTNIPVWHFMRLTEPITLAAGQTSAQTPACPWPKAKVPNGLLAHPCVRVLILPESLTDSVWSESFLRGLSTIPDSGDPDGKDLAGLMKAYGVTSAQTAQMNIEWSDTPVPCPDNCQPCQDVQLTDLRDGTVRRVGYQPPEEAKAKGLVAAKTDLLHSPKTAAVIDFQALGITVHRPGRRYTFFQSLGGVTKVIGLGYLKEKREVPLHFNISNSFDTPRTILLSTVVTLPPGEPPIEVKLTPFPGTFGKGETKAITVNASPKGGPPGPGPSPTPERGWDAIFAILIVILILILILIALVLMILRRMK